MKTISSSSTFCSSNTFCAQSIELIIIIIITCSTKRYLILFFVFSFQEWHTKVHICCGLMFFELVSILFAIVPDYGNEYMAKENKN